jgi:hypothetical protein
MVNLKTPNSHERCTFPLLKNIHSERKEETNLLGKVRIQRKRMCKIIKYKKLMFELEAL